MQLEAARIALARMFTAYREDLERVEVFKYLERLLTYDKNDSQAMPSNLKKARKSCARASCVLLQGGLNVPMLCLATKDVEGLNVPSLCLATKDVETNRFLIFMRS